jgi:hypothetical protein
MQSMRLHVVGSHCLLLRLPTKLYKAPDAHLTGDQL